MNMYMYIRVCSTRWIRGGSQIWPRERASRRAIATALSQHRCRAVAAVGSCSDCQSCAPLVGAISRNVETGLRGE